MATLGTISNTGSAYEVMAPPKLVPLVRVGANGNGQSVTIPDGYGIVGGCLFRQISSAGVQPGATGADNVLAAYSLPAGTLDGTGNRGVLVRAWGKYGATANNKTVKMIFNATTAVVGATVVGGTTVITTGVVASNNLPFFMEAYLFKYGAMDSNTQIVMQGNAFSGAAIVVPTIPALITATENAAILFAMTGNAATAASDILLHCFEVYGLN